MELVYIYHSGFALLGSNASLLFDFYEDSSVHNGFVVNELLKRPEPLYIFVSHFHEDHFNPQIFEFKKIKSNITYIISSDVWRYRRKFLMGQDFIKIRKGQKYNDDLIKVSAFGSTDSGVSFRVNLDGKEIFHAGDLNNWHWMAESTQEEVQSYESAYLQELALIKEECSYFDLVMFPVDPRLQVKYGLGACQFIENFAIKFLAPMHFGAVYKADSDLDAVAKAHHVSLLNIKERGQKFVLPL